jgi:hypothetical protein
LLLSNSIRRIVLNTVFVLVGAGIASAQSLPLRGMVTNKDVVTLAKAGFDEGFVIEVIQSSQRRFDTTADGIAGLIDQGISQTVIEVMIALSAPLRVSNEMPGIAGPVAYPASPDPLPETRTSVAHNARPAAVNAAIAGNVPYYEWKSLFFGLWRKKVGVGGVTRPNEMIGVQPSLYYRSLYPRPRYYLPVRAIPALPAPGVIAFSTHAFVP